MDAYKNEGGPAFPFHAKMGGGGGEITHYGMSLRDWFAAQAMTGMLATGDEVGAQWVGFAKDAYAMADAMLAERSQKTAT